MKRYFFVVAPGALILYGVGTWLGLPFLLIVLMCFVWGFIMGGRQ